MVEQGADQEGIEDAHAGRLGRGGQTDDHRSDHEDGHE